MTPSLNDNSQTDLPALVSHLQQIVEKIHDQVEQELARVDQARRLAARESARLEELLAKAQSAFGPSGEDTQPNLPQASSKSDSLEKHQEVYALAQNGVGPLEIAQQIGRTLGEVQLILALRKSQ